VTTVVLLYCLARARVHTAVKTLLPGCCLLPSEVLLWSTQTLVSTLAIDAAASWVLEIVLTACVVEIVLRSVNECSEMKVPPCLERSDETRVVVVAALPAQGCWLEAVLCRH